MKRFNLRPQQKLKTLQRGTMIVGGISIVAVAAYIMIGVQTARTLDSNANDNGLLANDPINNGAIVCGFSWEGKELTRSDAGPSAESISRNAEIVVGGKDNTRGLSAGNSGKGIDMRFRNDIAFNSDGIDISIDFRRFESSGSFLSRGKYFNFGMKDGKLCIKYKLQKEDGKQYEVEEITRYDIPEDTIFRNYRFIYNAAESKGEIFVDNTPVWSSKADDGDKMCWTADPLTLGADMNGEGKAQAIFDNLIIRATNRGRTMPLQLLSFSAELRGQEVMLTWFTGKEDGVDCFKIERSTDTYSYEEIGRVKAAGKSTELKAYALLDTKPPLGISYYRLSLPNTDVKSVWVPVIALKIPQLLPEVKNPVTSDAINK